MYINQPTPTPPTQCNSHYSKQKINHYIYSLKNLA